MAENSKKLRGFFFPGKARIIELIAINNDGAVESAKQMFDSWL